MKRTVYSEDQLRLYTEEYQNGLSITKISEKYGLNRHILSRELKANGVNVDKNGRKYTINENAFSEIKENEAYWLGFIAADGCVSATGGEEEPKVLVFNLNIKDKEHLEKFKQFINSNAIVKEIPGVGYGAGTTIAHLEVNSKKLVRDLSKYGICRAKSNILKPPNIPKEYYKDWIRGYLDGDGSISLLSNGEGQIAFEGTKEVLTFISQVLSPDKVKNLSQRHPESGKNNYHLAYGGTKTISNYLHFLYDNAEYYLDRKYQKALEVYSRFDK